MGDWSSPRNDCQPRGVLLKAGVDGPGKSRPCGAPQPWAMLRDVCVPADAADGVTGASCLVCHLARSNSLVEEL